MNLGSGSYRVHKNFQVYKISQISENKMIENFKFCGIYFV